MFIDEEFLDCPYCGEPILMTRVYEDIHAESLCNWRCDSCGESSLIELYDKKGEV